MKTYAMGFILSFLKKEYFHIKGVNTIKKFHPI